MPHAGSPPPPNRNQDPFNRFNSYGWSRWGANQSQPIRELNFPFDDAFVYDGSPRAGGASSPDARESSSSYSSRSWDSDDGEGLRNHSPENRESAGPDVPCELTAGTKRGSRENLPDSAEDEESPWHCAICTKLAEDAVQTPCCGTLHCRACIKRWLATPSSRSQCAFCRSRVSPNSLITDVRAERESASAVRRCSFAEHGCKAEGNRKKILEHERSCDFVPLSNLRRRIEELESKESDRKREYDLLKAQSDLSRSRLAIRDAEFETLEAKRAHDRTTMQRMSEEHEELSRKSQIHLNYANALLNCCLRENCATEAMKVLHNVCHARQYPRQLIHERFCNVLSFFLTDVSFKESNYNVSAIFTRKPGVTFCPLEDLTVALLHPYNPKWSVTIRVPLARWRTLRYDDSIIFENVIASEDFHDFCVEGKFYLSHSGHGARSRSSKLVCHCGAELSKSRHICRDNARHRSRGEFY